VPGAGVYPLIPGDPVTLTADPDDGSFFGGWVVDFEGTPVLSTSLFALVSVVPDVDVTATATFADAGFTLTTGVSGDGTVDPPAGAYAYATGTVVPLTATPNAPAVFDHWENGVGDNLGASNPLDVTVNADETRIAVFKSSVKVTVAHAGTGTGSTVPAVGVYSLNVGDPVTLTADPDEGDFFGGWLVDVSGVGAFNVYAYSFDNTVPGADTTVTATFDNVGFTLTTSASGDGTINPPAGTYAYSEGLVVPLTATPNGAARFDHWENAVGDNLGTDNPLTVTMNSDETRIAVFVSPITLTVVHSGTGTGTTAPPAGTSLVYPGDPITLAATPDSGSFFGGWSVDIGGSVVLTDNRYSFDANVPGADTTVTATFTDTGFSLTTGVIGEGSVNPAAGTYAFATDLEVPLTATPTGTAPFSHWEDAAGNRLPDGSDTSVVVDADVTRIAVFGFTLTLVKDGTGDGTTDPGSALIPGVKHNYSGGNATLGAFPNPTSVFTRWDGDLPLDVDPLASIITVPMDQDRAITAIFDAADFTLTVAQTGTGTVLPVPGGYGYLSGASQILTASLAANSGFAFSGWSGDITGDPASPVQTVIMNQNRSVTANFTNTDTISLSVLTDGPGTTQSAPGVYSYLVGQQFSFEAKPDAGKFFAGWTAKVDQGAGLVDVGTTYVTPILSDVLAFNSELTAHFGDTGHTITVLEPASGGSLLYPALPGDYILADGTSFVLKASPAIGWDFVGWKDGTGTTVSTDTEFQITVSADQSYQPVFALPGFTLTMIKAGAGNGTTTPASCLLPGTEHQITAGSVQVLTAVPASDSVFTGWSGNLPGTVNPLEKTIGVLMDQDRAITATFLPADFTLTVQVNGTANPVNVTPAPGAHGYSLGQQVNLIALPADGSPAAFQAWTGGVDGVPGGSFFATVTMNGNKTVTANFTDDTASSKQLVVNTPQGTGAGTTFPLSPGTYRIATNLIVRFGANPNPGSYFGGWLTDFPNNNTPQGLPVDMSQDHTVGASFSNTGYNVTVILEGLGKVTPGQGNYAFADGLQVTFTAERINSTWVFAGWRDGVDNPLSTSLSFPLTINAAAPTTIKGVFAEDTTAPEIIACAPDAALEPNGSCEWILPDYRGLVSATDDYGPVTLVQDPLAGEPITAATTVTITAKDMSTASPNDTCTFTVTPVDTLFQCSPAYNADQNQNQVIDLNELMRLIQFYNSPGSAYHCSPTPGDTEDGYVPGLNAALHGCKPSGADLNDDFIITLDEVLRVIQLFNAGGYWYCGSQSPDGDGVCAGQPATVRLIHASQGAPSVSLCVDGTADPTTLLYTLDTPYLEVAEASHEFGVILSVGGDCATPLLSETLGLLGGDKETLILGGPSAAPSIFPFADDMTVPAPGQARVRFIHMNPTLASPVDLRVSGGSTVWFNNVAYSTSGGYIEVAVGNYTLNVTDAAGTATLVTGIPLTLADGDVKTLVGAGTGAGGFNALVFTD
jgi:hypothetical protein